MDCRSNARCGEILIHPLAGVVDEKVIIHGHGQGYVGDISHGGVAATSWLCFQYPAGTRISEDENVTI